MKLIIDVGDLANLLYRLHHVAYEHRHILQFFANREGIDLASAVSSWQALCIDDFSNCALTVEEYIAAIDAGDRLNPNEFARKIL